MRSACDAVLNTFVPDLEVGRMLHQIARPPETNDEPLDALSKEMEAAFHALGIKCDAC